MNSSKTELYTSQRKQEYIDNDNPSSIDGGSDKNSKIHPGPRWMPDPPSDVCLPGLLPYPPQHSVQPGMIDPLSLRFHCPCQFSQCQLTNSDYCTEPLSWQYHRLPGPVPGLPEGSHPSSVFAPWFTREPILCSMPGDSHASSCVPQAVDHQHHKGLTEFTSHLTQPVVCNERGGGPVVLVNTFNPEPVILALKSATQGDDSQTKEKGVNLLGTLSQYQQILHGSRDETVNMQPQPPKAQTVVTLCESKCRKPCHCTRSQCLKLYCECFASGVMCRNCDCSNCHNNPEHEMTRHNAIKSCLGRNPDAFRPKFAGGKSGQAKGWHNKGCNCKRSGCLKNYCECYEANIKCTTSCKCVGCRNYEHLETGLKEKTVNVKDKWHISVITPAVVEAVCICLLAQAEQAERDVQNLALAEHMVLDEFEHCLKLIVKAMFKNNT